MTTADITALIKLPPGEASAALAQRDTMRVSYDWAQVWQEEHAAAFTISRLARADILDALYKGIQKSVDGDMSRRDWTKSATELLKKEGWWGENIVPVGTLGDTVTTVFNARRVGLIFDTNITTAAAAGRWERLQSTKVTYPYLTYKTRDDGRVRPAHAEWNNVTLPIDHSFWKTHYPPNGWRCRCFVLPMRQKEVDADPNLITTAPKIEMVDWENKATGLTQKVPAGIDPGWGYNTGIAGRTASLKATEKAKLEQWHPDVAKQYSDKLHHDYIALGSSLTSKLPDGLKNPEEFHSQLMQMLKRDVGVDTPAKLDSQGHGSDLVKRASTLFPDSWTKAADDFGRLKAKAGENYRGSYNHVAADAETKVLAEYGKVAHAKAGDGFITVPFGDTSAAIHEYTHRLQSALPELDRIFQNLHRERVAGQAVKRLKDVDKIYAHYADDELTREDHYHDAYQGKEYNTRTENGVVVAEDGGAKEVMTVAFETVLGGSFSKYYSSKFQKLYQLDRPMLDLIIGLLRHWKP